MQSIQTIAKDIKDIAKAENQLTEAHLNLDIKTIERLLHPDYIIIQPGGVVETKAEVLNSYHTGKRHWDTAQVDELDIRLYGDTAIVVGRWQASGQHDAVQFDYSARLLSIWVRLDGSWQNTAYQSTKIKSP